MPSSPEKNKVVFFFVTLLIFLYSIDWTVPIFHTPLIRFQLMNFMIKHYFLFDLFQARVGSENEHFLVNPFGMMYSEVTASALVKVDVLGDTVDQGSSHFGVSKPSFALHSAIHQARPDIKCVVHLHNPASVAVSS